MEFSGFFIESNLDDIIKNIEYELEFDKELVMDKLKDIGQDILDSSQAIVPIDTATLKNSAFIMTDEEAKEVYVGYAPPTGGVNPKNRLHVRVYAEEVHENTYVPHEQGQAKFLEYPARNRLMNVEKELLDVID